MFSNTTCICGSLFPQQAKNISPYRSAVNDTRAECQSVSLPVSGHMQVFTKNEAPDEREAVPLEEGTPHSDSTQEWLITFLAVQTLHCKHQEIHQSQENTKALGHCIIKLVLAFTYANWKYKSVTCFKKIKSLDIELKTLNLNSESNWMYYLFIKMG